MTNIDSYFCGVGNSCRGKAWLDALDRRQANLALSWVEKYDMPEALARVLVARSIDEEDLERFLNPTIKHNLPDPLTFKEMKPAAERIAKAIEEGEKIAIFGDYDVDGACATALLKKFIGFFANNTLETYIPDRMIEGYGPNPQALELLISRGATLIIFADCGSTAKECMQICSNHKVDTIVLDHHQVDDCTLGASAFVNPNRPDDFSNQGHLCAAGVVFITLVQIIRVLREKEFSASYPDLLSYLDLVALATVCDVVPLIGINRAFVAKGIEVARKSKNIGLLALAECTKIHEPLNSFHFGYILGPCLNAGGRIGNSSLAVTLLTTTEEQEAQTLAKQLAALNIQRQELEKTQLAQAETDLHLSLGQNQTLPSVIVVANKDWHQGVVGLIAARLKEYYHRIAIAIALREDGIGLGSGRSVVGYDLGALIQQAKENDLLITGGGHAMAAGISLYAEKIDSFQKWICSAVEKAQKNKDIQEHIKIDAIASAAGATEEFYDILNRAAPFGSGNPAPVLAFLEHKIVHIREVGAGHLSFTLSMGSGAKIKAIAFRAKNQKLGDFLIKNEGRFVHVLGNLSLNYWNNRKTPQLIVMDAAIPA